jgi:WD40 repeat protein
MFTRLLLVILVGLGAALPAPAEDARPEVRFKLEAHRGGVGALAFSPNGELIATGSGNGVLRLWDTRTGEVVAKLDQVGGSRIVHTGFSADGQILSVAARKAVIAWNVADPKKPRALVEDGLPESRHKFGGVSGDGKRVYHTDVGNGTLRVWEVPNNSYATSYKLNQFTPVAVALAPDADSALAVILGGNDLRAPTLLFVGLGDSWRVSEGLTAVDDEKPNTVAFAPDGKWLTVCSNGTVNVWKVPGSQKVSGKPRAIGTDVLAAAAGPNNLLAVAERPEAKAEGKADAKKVRITITDLVTEKQVAAFATDIDEVSCLAFAPDGKTLAVADTVEGVVQLWALPAKK